MLYHLRLVNNAPKAVLLVTRDPLSEVVRVESGPIIDLKKKNQKCTTGSKSVL